MELDLTALLGDVVDRVAAVDACGLDHVSAQTVLTTLQATINRLTGVRDRVLGDLHAAGQGQVVANPDSDVPVLFRSLQSWWRDTCTLPGQQAGAEVRRAAVLHDLPIVRDAVVPGALTPAQAAVLTRLHGGIDHAGLVESQPHLVPVVAPLPVDALNRWVSHQIATHCAPVIDADDRSAETKRLLQLRQEADGTVRGRFVLTTEQAEIVSTILEPLARRQGLEDGRSIGQRRADALVDVYDGTSRWMDLPDAGGKRPQVTYTITAAWAAKDLTHGFAERIAEACAGHGAHPLAMSRYAAEGAWTGPQTRARIESALCDAQVSRVLWHKGRIGWRDLHLPWLPDPHDPDHPRHHADDLTASDPPDEPDLFDEA